VFHADFFKRPKSLDDTHTKRFNERLQWNSVTVIQDHYGRSVLVQPEMEKQRSPLV
jgi:hypothetical protein